MNKTKFLTILSVALLLINLVLIGLMVMGPLHHRHHHKGPKAFIQEKLNLDEAQVQAYEGLITQHKIDLKPLRKEIRTLRKELFSILAETSGLAKKDQMLYQIGEAQKRMESAHLKHFSDLKKICRAEQIEAYNSMLGELANLLKPPGKPPKSK